MKPARIFQVYQEHGNIEVTRLEDEKPQVIKGPWRWRLVATRNRQVVGGSQESFDSRGNALRAARREASFYQAGTVEVAVA